MRDIQIMLECGCTPRRRYSLAVGENDPTSYCLYHGWQKVVKRFLEEYHLRCLALGCSYSRWFGQSEPSAHYAANRHRTRHPEHRVAVVYDVITLNGRGLAFTDMRRARIQYLSSVVQPDTLDINRSEPPPF